MVLNLLRLPPFVVGALLSVCAFLQAPAQIQQEGPLKTCMPSFPYAGGWLGGDAAYSVLLPDGRTLWLFGDSIVADNPGERVRARGKEMVRNAIGISQCDSSGNWRMQYFWSGRFGDNPRAFFESGSLDWWYWPADAFTHNGRVYVVLRKLRGKPGERMFPFEVFGAVLARVSNLDESPGNWKIEYADLVEETNDNFAATVVVKGAHAYFFSVARGGQEFPRPLVLARSVLEELDDSSPGLEYLAKDRTWKPGYQSEDALAVLPDGHSEMSIRYHETIGRWVAVTQGPEFLSKRIMIRTARELEGPWGEPQRVYDFPEMNSASPGYDKDTFCYAVKEHAQLGTEDKLLITYVCNSFDFGKMVANMEIYLPRPIWVPLPDPIANGPMDGAVEQTVER